MQSRKRSHPSPKTILRGHQAGLSSAAFISERTLVSGDEKGEVRVWDCEAEECVAVWRGKEGALTQILKEKGREGRVLVVYKSGWVQRVDVEQEVGGGELEGWRMKAVGCSSGGGGGRWLGESFCGGALVGDGVLVGGGRDGEVVLRDLDRGVEIGKLVEKGMGMVMCVGGMGEGRCLAGYEDGGVILWDIGMRKKVGEVKIGKEAVVSCVGCVRGGVGIVGGVEGKLTGVAEGEGGRLEVVKEVVIRGEGGVGALVWGRKVVVSGGWDGRVRVWNGRRDRRLLDRVVGMKWHRGSVGCLAMGESLLASGGKDRTIALWGAEF